MSLSASCRLNSLLFFTCEGETDNPILLLLRLLFFGLLFLSLQLTAPKSQVWPELDSSLYQVTQHPTSLHPSISTRPTQPLLPFISLRAGFILELGRDASPCLPLSDTHIFTLPFLFHNCLFPFLPQPFLYFSQSLFSPPSTERYQRVCVAFVAQLTAIQKPLLACHRCDVVRRRCTRTNLSSVEPAFRKSLFILR